MNLALEALSALMHAVYYLFSVFYLFFALRFILDFLPLHLHSLRRLLFRATEPFLGLFARLVCLRWRRRDFTPLLAVVALFVFQQVVLRYLLYVVIKARGGWCG